MGIDQLRQKLEAARHSFDYRLEQILYDVTEQICQLIEDQQLSRRELAQRLKVSPAYITKLLNGNPNLTIETLLKLSDALGQTLDIRFAPKLEAQIAITTSQANFLLNVPPISTLGTANVVTTSQPILLPSTELPAYPAKLPTVSITQCSELNEANNHELALAA